MIGGLKKVKSMVKLQLVEKGLLVAKPEEPGQSIAMQSFQFRQEA